MTTTEPSSFQPKLKQVTASFADEVARHAKIMARLATFADENGYVVIPHDRLHALSGGWLEGYISSALKIWGENVGAKFVTVHLRSNENFGFVLPRTRRLRPVVIAMKMMAKVRNKKTHMYEGQGFLYMNEASNEYRFSGKGLDELRIVCNVLGQHRMILKSQHAVKLPE